MTLVLPESDLAQRRPAVVLRFLVATTSCTTPDLPRSRRVAVRSESLGNPAIDGTKHLPRSAASSLQPPRYAQAGCRPRLGADCLRAQRRAERRIPGYQRPSAGLPQTSGARKVRPRANQTFPPFSGRAIRASQLRRRPAGVQIAEDRIDAPMTASLAPTRLTK
jgi:hypothetical protein